MRPIDERQPSLLRRLGWLVLIWTISVGALGLVALAIRLLMQIGGMAR